MLHDVSQSFVNAFASVNQFVQHSTNDFHMRTIQQCDDGFWLVVVDAERHDVHPPTNQFVVWLEGCKVLLV